MKNLHQQKQKEKEGGNKEKGSVPCSSNSGTLFLCAQKFHTSVYIEVIGLIHTSKKTPLLCEICQKSELSFLRYVL